MPTCIKKRLQHRCFPVNIAKFFKNSFFIEKFWWLATSGSNHITSFWTLTFWTYRRNCLKSFRTDISARKKQLSSFRKHELCILLGFCANNLVDSFPFKYMSRWRSLIWLNHIWRSWYLIICLEIPVQSFTMGFWTFPFSNWLYQVIVSNFVSGVAFKTI